MRYGVVQPILVINGLSLELGNIMFVLLIISVVAIAAAGYMINDYFDVDTDTLNKPDKVIVGKVFTANSVYYSYIILNVLALALAFYVTLQIHFLSMFLIFPLASGILWFYSNTYKRQFLIGNLLVSFLLAGVPMVPLFYEIPLVLAKYKTFIVIEGLSLKYLYVWVGAFSVFAFIINMIREIIKDAEDFYGDELSGCMTLPIVLGEKVTRIIIIVLTALVMALVIFVFIYFLMFNRVGNIDFISLIYLSLFIVLPLSLIIYNSLRFKEKKGYTRSSALIKAVLVFGLIYAWILRNKVI
jgi:4-hydroxybenzoate polyprenyltransferase